jgi:1-aminocyclopropane-1-carboxylate deaminase
VSETSIGPLEGLLNIQSPSPTQVILPDWQGAENYQISLKRDDLLHPIISGNKWRKLKYALLAARQNQVSDLISFGGGFSNHLHALGYCCRQMNIRFTAIVRGDYADNLSPMLQDLISWGAELNYVDRSTYKRRDEPAYLAELQQAYPGAVIIPEGGSQQLALQGVGEIIGELRGTYDYILAPVASGGTLAGLIHANQSAAAVIIGVAVLKGQSYLESLVTGLLPASAAANKNWHINHEYHGGGYAKTTSELKAFCEDFFQQRDIPIEPVYSGKLFFALKDLIAKQVFPSGSRILALHTGGLQGAR